MPLSRREMLAMTAAAAALPGAASAAPAPVVWDLSELYPTDAAWAAERTAIEAALPGLARFKGHLGDDAGSLRAALAAVSDLRRRLGRLIGYAWLKADEDLRVAANQERRQLAEALGSKLDETTAWMSPEILAIGRARIEGFLAADPGLARFRFGLEDTLRLAPHTLDPAGEQLVALTADTLTGPRTFHDQLVFSDIPWPEVTLSTGKVRLDSQGYTSARASRVRSERKQVMDAFFGTFATYESSLGASLTTEVRAHMFTAKARHYDSALDSALAPTGIPPAVYRTLIAEANRGLPVLYRYFDLRRRMLGLPDLRYYDIYPPLTALDRKFDLAEIRRLTLEAVKPLGPDYVETLGRATAARWMHPYPQPGKAAGAYMWGSVYDVHPYLLLNLTDDYESLTTFAHEWGHAMHSLAANKAQPFETADYPIFTAEIASTLNEQLLADYMLGQAKTREEKLFYLDRVCELIRSTFYRQTMFAEFELAIHETAEKGEALSGKKMTAIYLDLLKRYHGPGMTIDPAYATEWAYIPHFYRDFYVYQYATSLTASVAFAETIRTGGAAARDRYLSVLKAGGSDYPVDILKRAGVDMTSPEPYRALIAKFARTIDQMEALVGTKGQP